jgi:hypothetical protein
MEGKTMNYETMTDDELVEIRKSMPKYLNHMTEEQVAVSKAVYAEQKKRYDNNKAASYTQYNQEVEAAGYKVGDRVSYFARYLLGIGGIVIKGTVAKRKKYYVKLDILWNNKKTAHLTNGWKVEPA